MSFIPGKSRTKVVPEGRRFQARYLEPDIGRWFDLGDPRDTEEEAKALIKEFNEPPQGGVGVTYDIQGHYGQGWETVTAETTKEEAKERLKEYRENEPGVPFRIKRVKESA